MINSNKAMNTVDFLALAHIWSARLFPFFIAMHHSYPKFIERGSNLKHAVYPTVASHVTDLPWATIAGTPRATVR